LEGGEVVPPAAEAARTRLRHHALERLRAEVATQVQQMSSGSPAEAAAARQVLESLSGFPALARVRQSELANLPEPERQVWQALWQEIEGLLRGSVPAR
jgi:hypothetical protein